MSVNRDFTTSQINEVAYSDLDFFFNSHPMTKDVIILHNVSSIKRSVRNLVLTNSYEKIYNPYVYADVLGSLFENFDPILVTKLKSKIEQVLQFEPRVRIEDIRISSVEQLDRNGINITIVFTPINRIRKETIDIFIERVR